MLLRQDSETLEVFAPAKLNLFLDVLGKRPDGYHNLETLMVSVGLYDSLRLSPAPAAVTALTCRDARRRSSDHEAFALSAGPDNLVLRAVAALRRATGTQAGVRIQLLKRIPLAAGLAGGSTDAAATLVGLNRFWNLNLTYQELHALAAELGSDVPFFLCPTGAAVCRGRGEILEPVDLPALHFVIVRPATGLSTATVFQHCRPGDSRQSARPLVAALQRGDLRSAAAGLFNALQAPAETLNADVGRLARTFARQPVVGHLMSGSGTSYFGICTNRPHAAMVAARFRAERAGQVFVAQSRV
jgi:4-diphosphocytidyl-2-C-methyl-D-erythritol kinase